MERYWVFLEDGRKVSVTADAYNIGTPTEDDGYLYFFKEGNAVAVFVRGFWIGLGEEAHVEHPPTQFRAI